MYMLLPASGITLTELTSYLCNYYSNSFNFVIIYLGKDPIYTIPVKNILAVEKLEESSFNKKNVSCISIESILNCCI